MRGYGRILPVVLGLTLFPVSPARAGDVFTEESVICKDRPASESCLTMVYFRARPGEINRVAARVDSGEMVVTDTATPPVAGAGCRASGNEVRCGLRGGRGQMWVYLYDGDDTVEMAALGVAYGGAGGDVLRNRGRPRGNLRALYGGSGGDVIRGGADEDLLTGGAGADRIDAGAGDDDIWGNRGRDRILAGRGDDEIHARDSARDSVVCGPGSDALGADPRDRFSSSCETVAQRAVREGPNVVIGDARLRRNSRLRVRLSCPRKVGRLGCSGLLAGRLAGSRRNGPATRYRIRARRSRAVTIRLRRADARRIRRRARGTVRIRSVERGHLGRKITIREVDIRA